MLSMENQLRRQKLHYVLLNIGMLLISSDFRKADVDQYICFAFAIYKRHLGNLKIAQNSTPQSMFESLPVIRLSQLNK